MSAQQPEALRLADELENAAGDYFAFHKKLGYGASAELRRLHVENEAQKKALRAYMDTISQFHHAVADAGWHPGRTDDLLTDVFRSKGEELRCLHAANLDCMEWYKAVKSERDELLEALARLVGCIDHGSENPTEKLDAARAAIAKAIG